MRRHNETMDIDLSNASPIAFASAQGDYADQRPRWAELSVFELADGRYVAQSVGRSTVPGERDRFRRLPSRDLERALKLFDDNEMGRVVAEQAREYVEDKERVAAARAPWSEAEALTALYGAETDASGLPALLSEDFGVKRSTARMALKNDTGVNVPLAGIMPFIDMAKFRAHREAGKA